MMVFYASFVHIVEARLGQADAGDNEAKLTTKLAPEWVRTSDPVIRSPARYRWTTAPAQTTLRKLYGRHTYLVHKFDHNPFHIIMLKCLFTECDI